MKLHLIGALISTSIALLPTFAAEIVQSYKDAQDQYGENGYIVFAYADGWDTYSKRVCSQLMESESMHQVVGDAVLMEYAVPQVQTEEFVAAQKERFGKLKMPGIDHYPALIMFDRNEHHYATISGASLTDSGKSRLVTVLGTRIREMQEQLRLLNEARKVDGIERARLLGQAATMPNINPPDKVVEQIRAADPQDESGYIRRLEFQPWQFAESIRKEPLETAIPKMEAMLEDTAYSAEQKQAICACIIGMLHRSPNKIADMQRIPDVAKRMKSYAPDTVLAQSADVVLSAWISNTVAEQEWTPENLPTSSEPIDMLGVQPPLEPGNYVVVFSYRSGMHGVGIRSVALMNGEEVVAADEHTGFAGNQSKDNEYLIRVRKRVESPRWLFSFDLSEKVESNGVITIIRK